MASAVSTSSRVRARIVNFFPTGAAGWVLVGLLIAGLALRIVAEVSYWPATTTLSDAIPFSAYALDDPIGSPQHPPGYSLLLAAIGLFTREVAVTIALQHLLGITSALLTFAAVRRLSGSPWPGIAAAAIMLLDADIAYLEHSIMSEGTFIFALSLALYAAARAIDQPEPPLRWPVIGGLALGLAVMVRTAGAFVIPVAAAAMIASHPRPWLPRWRPVAALVGAAAAVLLALAIVNQVHNGRFEIGPTQGWHLYQRGAPFADCSRFTPPEGTEQLCETTPAAERLGGDHYLYDEDSPARIAFGDFGNADDKVGAFARAAILAQPRDYARAVWRDLKAYWVPGSRPYVDGAGGDLDPQLDWEITLPPDSRFDAATKAGTQKGMELFFNPFTVDQDAAGIRFLDTVQRIFRFGGTLLSLATLLVLVGLFVGPRRNRVGVLLFGGGGLALLAAPSLSAIYIGRYTVPAAGPLVGAAAIAILSVARLEVQRRRATRDASAA